jgi:hypothetical protein
MAAQFIHDEAAPSTFVGTRAQLQKKLEHDAAQGTDRAQKSDRARKFVVVELDGKLAANAEDWAQAVSSVLRLLKDTAVVQDAKTVKALVDLLTPKSVAPAHLVREAEMIADAKKVILESGDWLNVVELAKIAGLSQTNPNAQPWKWKKKKQIFTIDHAAGELYPGYALDERENYRPRKGLQPILELFGASMNGWGLALWFMSANGMLGGKAPKDVLAKDPEKVLIAARHELESIDHA